MSGFNFFNMKIFYIGFYTGKGNPNKFKEFPSCNNKMHYIINALKSNNFNVNIFSLGEGNNFKTLKTQKIDDLESITYVSTLPNQSFFKIISRIWLLFQVLYFLLFQVQKEDVVIVYHTYILLPILKIAKRIKNINLIIEVEEIYTAAWKQTDEQINKEIKDLKIADKYILINDLVAKQCNFTKPNVVCYGNYKTIFSQSKIINRDEISIVYAGIIEGIDSDIYLAINAMKYLPSNYNLKIIGYGFDNNIVKLKEYISSLDNVVYDGLLNGDEYRNYLHNCDIGISPRLLEDKYSDYTFPSKVLVYLSHGLITVSTTIKAIKESKVASSIYFIKNLTPKDVADTILKIDYRNLKDANIISELDQCFKEDLKKIIHDFN